MSHIITLRLNDNEIKDLNYLITKMNEKLPGQNFTKSDALRLGIVHSKLYFDQIEPMSEELKQLLKTTN